jgi:ATP-dependent RNA helicase RhlE
VSFHSVFEATGRLTCHLRAPGLTPGQKSMTFASLGLSDSLLRALADIEHTVPTEVQRAAIPVILQGRDVWASAQTGSGKTGAFLLPILQMLSTTKPSLTRDVRALILVPTRELAIQIEQEAQRYARHLPVPLKTCLAIGGVSINPQMMALRGGADLVVATPGRLLDLVANNAVRLSSVKWLVLDEADRMLSLGFAAELANVLSLVTSPHQRLLFSATFPSSVRLLVEEMLDNPEAVNLHTGTTPSAATIQQRVIEVDAGRRTSLLRHLIKEEAWSRVLVFVASGYSAKHVTQKLVRAGVKASALHGELSQSARQRSLDDFKAIRVQVLVATDVASRGLDIVELPIVVNYDLPRSSVDYLHRIGRTGRAGETGVAVSFVSVATAGHFALIEKRHALTLAREQIAGFEPQELEGVPKDASGGIKGKRKSKKDKLREAAAMAASAASGSRRFTSPS